MNPILGHPNTTVISGVQTWLDTVEQKIGYPTDDLYQCLVLDAHLNSNLVFSAVDRQYDVSSPKIPGGWTNMEFLAVFHNQVPAAG